MKYYYEKSGILDSKINITYHELFCKTDEELDEWIEEVRQYVIKEWDEKGIPPTIGQNTNDIKKNFRKLRDYPLHQGRKQFLTKDEDTGEYDVIKNYNKHASGVNQFFPTMLKTRVNKSSIYTWFTDEYKDKFQKVIRRILKRDSMYNWSRCLLEGEELPENFFVVQHRKNSVESEYLTLSKSTVENLAYLYTTNLPDELDDTKYKFLVHRFELGQKLFPAGIQAFRLGLGQPAVNFPPLTARYLYEKYIKHIKQDTPLNIYDPSSGWGGRILGAMSSFKRIHYIGTDPNTDNFIDELGITRYEYVASFFNNEVLETNPFWEEDKNTYHLFQDGSENIGNNPEFQTYKGTLDLVFTSPPYFDREQYSEDKEQSYKLYPKYEDWRDNFLKPTLTTSFEYLKQNRYLLWNISDIKIGKDKYHPLEQDSIDIIESLGGEYKSKLKMLMTSMVGVDQSKVKNSVKVGGTYLKYEPIFVFFKPEKT